MTAAIVPGTVIQFKTTTTVRNCSYIARSPVGVFGTNAKKSRTRLMKTDSATDARSAGKVMIGHGKFYIERLR